MQDLMPLLMLGGLLCVCACGAAPAVTIENGEVRSAPPRGREGVREARVVVPRVWMQTSEILVAAHRQAGLLYAIVPARFEAPVGPFRPGEAVKMEELARRVAEAANARVQWVGNVAVFDPAAAAPQAAMKGAFGKTSEKVPDARARVSYLDAIGDSSTLVELTRLAGSEDGAVRLHALAALTRLEGDFMRATYPGRVSVFEVYADAIDRGALLYALEEGGPAGSRNWKLAVELLGRARERVLARHLWELVWQKQEGTMEHGLWALGRCGDPSAGWGMRGRVRETASNDPSHPYLAAMALGQLDSLEHLERDRDSPDADLRRATAFGLGFCLPDNERALRHLLDLLADGDPSVRYVACQSLARLGPAAALARLTALASDGAAAADLRASALDALVSMGRPEAEAAVLAAAADPSAAVRAAAAGLLGETGGPRALAALPALAGDADRRVRCAAIHSLARLGTEEGLARAAAVLTAVNANADERIAALQGLGRSLSPRAAEPLARVARDKTVPGRLRNYAVLGLARLAGRAGQKTVAELADFSSERFLTFAVRHLELDTPQATAQRLIPYLTHSGPDRDTACAAAGRLAELGYGPATVELLEGSDVFANHTRMMHMWGAVRSPGREATLALAAAAASPRGSIRGTAAMALGGRLYPEAVDALLRLARDRQSGVRTAAARSLGVTPDPLAVDALIELAVDDEPRVALEAVQALRSRDFRHLPRVREVLRQIAGTPRDPGGIDPATPALGDQPAHSFVLRAWAEHVEEDLVCNLTYESSMCYDAYRQRIVQWGAHGRRYDTPQTGQTWFYDTAGNQWRRLTDSRHWPNGTCCIRGTMYDNANYAVISPRSGGSNGHGWHNALRVNLTHSSPWILDVKSDQWYAASPLNADAGGGFMPGSHDPLHGVTLWWKDKLIGFDVYANRWFRFRPEGPAPSFPSDTGGVFDPLTGRFIAVAERATWAFEPAKNAWSDLKAEGDLPPPCPMVYDSANDVMLAFKEQGQQVGVWVYHLRQNRWEALPAVYPCPARGHIVDAAYDEKNNVVVIHGTHPSGASASLNARQTWTYRYKERANSAAAPRPPRDIVCVTAADGGVKIGWTPAAGAVAARYRIERGVGEQPWLVKWEAAGEVEGGRTEFADAARPKALAFYRAIAVGADGKESRPSLPGRTTPRIVRQVTAVASAAGGVQVRWAAAREADIVGYNVYRAPVDLGSPWSRRFAPESVAETLQRISPAPVAAVEFLDKTARIEGPSDELTWPHTFAYVVRPVNAWGLEGGASPVTLALPDPPGPVQVIPWADGRRLVLWNQCLSGGVEGYCLMRMDDWHSQHVFRLQPAPLLAPGCWDGEEFPTCDRRRYYASGVDTLGTLGLPTSGAWSHGFP